VIDVNVPHIVSCWHSPGVSAPYCDARAHLLNRFDFLALADMPSSSRLSISSRSISSSSFASFSMVSGYSSSAICHERISYERPKLY
jgi:hypothetical protein